MIRTEIRRTAGILYGADTSSHVAIGGKAPVVVVSIAGVVLPVSIGILAVEDGVRPARAAEGIPLGSTADTET